MGSSGVDISFADAASHLIQPEGKPAAQFIIYAQGLGLAALIYRLADFFAGETGPAAVG
jgi:hypothetical protein